MTDTPQKFAVSVIVVGEVTKKDGDTFTRVRSTCVAIRTTENMEQQLERIVLHCVAQASEREMPGSTVKVTSVSHSIYPR